MSARRAGRPPVEGARPAGLPAGRHALGRTLRRRALGVALGLTLDRLAGEPPTAWHPVAWFGTAMSRVERRLYADARLPGAAYALVGVGAGAGSGWLLSRLGRRLPGR